MLSRSNAYLMTALLIRLKVYLRPKASTIGIWISPTPPLIFTGGQKVRHLASFETSLNFEPPAFENAARLFDVQTSGQVW